MRAMSDRERRELERAMRSHPAGKRLRRRGEVRCEPRPPRPVPCADLPAAVAARVCLTARGRRAVAALALGLVVGSAVPAAVPLVGTRGGGGGNLRLVGESSVVVRSGDSLWSIASSVAGEDDIRDVVHRIQQANHLRGTDLSPGQVLVLP